MPMLYLVCDLFFFFFSGKHTNSRNTPIVSGTELGIKCPHFCDLVPSSQQPCEGESPHFIEGEPEPVEGEEYCFTLISADPL